MRITSNLLNDLINYYLCQRHLEDDSTLDTYTYALQLGKKDSSQYSSSCIFFVAKN